MHRDPDSFYVEDCRTVQTKTQAIQASTGQISRLIGTMETEQDFIHCHKMIDDTVREASATRQLLARIQEHQRNSQNAAERNNRRMMYQKLSDNLVLTARVLEDVIRRFTAEEKARTTGQDYDSGGFGRSKGSSTDPGQHSAADSAAGGGLNLLDGVGEEKSPLLPGSEGETSLQQELEKDRCQALKRVDEDMRCLQRIYTDLASVNEAQQSTFDTLEHHMASAAADIERGRDEIMITRDSWDRRMKRKLLGIAGGIIAVTAFAFFAMPS